jgi:hypothetical protein
MKKNCSIAAFIFMALFAFCSVAVYGQNNPPVSNDGVGPWRYLGEKVVSFSVGGDMINVKKAGVFRKLKFKVMDAPVQIGGIRVGLENGAVLDIPLQIRLGEGRESKEIELIGIEAGVKVVYFTYRPGQEGDKRKAKIILMGQE